METKTILATLCSLITLGRTAEPAKPLDFWAPSDQKVVLYTKAQPPTTPRLDDLALKKNVSQYGITWTFDQPARIGHFVNGDWYVIGPVTVTEISPKPLYRAPSHRRGHRHRPVRDRALRAHPTFHVEGGTGEDE